jgi:hypothetical protein
MHRQGVLYRLLGSSAIQQSLTLLGCWDEIGMCWASKTPTEKKTEVIPPISPIN